MAPNTNTSNPGEHLLSRTRSVWAGNNCWVSSCCNLVWAASKFHQRKAVPSISTCQSTIIFNCRMMALLPLIINFQQQHICFSASRVSSQGSRLPADSTRQVWTATNTIWVFLWKTCQLWFTLSVASDGFPWQQLQFLRIIKKTTVTDNCVKFLTSCQLSCQDTNTNHHHCQWPCVHAHNVSSYWSGYWNFVVTLWLM